MQAHNRGCCLFAGALIRRCMHLLQALYLGFRKIAKNIFLPIKYALSHVTKITNQICRLSEAMRFSISAPLICHWCKVAGSKVSDLAVPSL